MTPAKKQNEAVMIACFTCEKMPGMKGWAGYFTKAEDGTYRHMNCPKAANR